MTGYDFEPWDPGPDWDPSEGLLTRDEVRRLYGVRSGAVSRWARTRQMPAIRLPGGDWRFSRRWVRLNLKLDQLEI